MIGLISVHPAWLLRPGAGYEGRSVSAQDNSQIGTDKANQIWIGGLGEGAWFHVLSQVSLGLNGSHFVSLGLTSLKGKGKYTGE